MTKEDVKSIFADLIGEPKTQYPRTQTALAREAEIASVITNVNLLERMVRVEEGTQHTLDAIHELQRSTDKRLEAMQANMDKRFEDTGKLLEVIQANTNKRLEDMGKRLEDMGKRLEDMGKRLEAMQANTNERFKAMQANMDKRFEDMQANTNKRFEETQANTNKRFEDMGKLLGAMQANTNKRFEDMGKLLGAMQANTDKRFKAVFWSAGVCFGVLTALMSGMLVMLINIATG